MARQHIDPNGSTRVMNKMYGVIRQRYSGDINLFPRQSARQLMKMFSNPSENEIQGFIRDGERATWPKIERIRNQTRISRTFEHCLLLLKQRATPWNGAERRAPLRAINA